WASACFRSSTMERLPRLAARNMAEMSALRGPTLREVSPEGDSILMTSAPWSASMPAAIGPDRTADRSSTRMPSSGPAMVRLLSLFTSRPDATSLRPGAGDRRPRTARHRPRKWACPTLRPRRRHRFPAAAFPWLRAAAAPWRDPAWRDPGRRWPRPAPLARRYWAAWRVHGAIRISRARNAWQARDRDQIG